MRGRRWIAVVCGVLMISSVGCSTPAPEQPSKTAPSGNVWKVGDPSYIPFKAWSIVVSGDNGYAALVGKTGRDRADGSYLLDLKTGEHHELPTGSNFVLPIAGGHRFLVFSSRDSPVRLFDGFEMVRAFESAKASDGWVNPKNNSLIYQNAWPGDREGFSGIGILQVKSGLVETIILQEPTERLGFCPVSGTFYTEHIRHAEEFVDEYSPDGKFLRSSQQPFAMFSADCRYALPLSAIASHGPAAWSVFDTDSGAAVMDFPYSEESPRFFEEWNPAYGNLLFTRVLSLTRGRIEILDVALKKVVATFDDTPAAWSGDGKSLVLIQNKHVVFKPLSR